MKMSGMNLFLLGTIILTSLSAHAVEQLDPIGGLIKNRKTKEYLGTRCSDAKETCKSLVFALYEKDGNSFIHLKDVGVKFSYGFISNNRRDALYKQFDDRDYPEVYIDNHAVTLPTVLMVDSIAGDYSIAGGAWRFLTGLVLLPMAAVVDGVRYSGEAVFAGAATIYEVAEGQLNKGKANRSYKNLIRASRKTSKGKVVKVSGSNFDKILGVLQNY
jgi:hypothetical protein